MATFHNQIFVLKLLPFIITFGLAKIKSLHTFSWFKNDNVVEKTKEKIADEYIAGKTELAVKKMGIFLTCAPAQDKPCTREEYIKSDKLL